MYLLKVCQLEQRSELLKMEFMSLGALIVLVVRFEKSNWELQPHQNITSGSNWKFSPFLFKEKGYCNVKTRYVRTMCFLFRELQFPETSRNIILLKNKIHIPCISPSSVEFCLVNFSAIENWQWELQ